MIRTLAAAAITVLLAGAAPAAPLDGQQTYDLLFRNGTLDAISRDAALVYRRDVTNTIKPETGDRDTGAIALTFREGQDATLAKLEFRKDGKYRVLGSFPASVGNPMIMYFYEAVVRDMAESAGGSPFYIRNRVKEALIQPSEVEPGTAMVDGRSVETRTIRMHPFADDPNRDRMQGFGDLELRVTVSEEVPGWYLSLVAEADGGAVYRSELAFDRLDASQ